MGLFSRKPKPSASPIPAPLSAPTSPTSAANTATGASREGRILDLGSDMLRRARAHKAGVLSAKFYSDALMEWSMKDHEFKVQMFRFVDAFPMLKTPEAVFDHLHDYLSQPGVTVPPVIATALKAGGLAKGLAAKTISSQITGMASKFIAGTDAASALPGLRDLWNDGIAFSVDLLGETCVSDEEADMYAKKYLDLIENLPKDVAAWKSQPRLESDHLGPIPRTNVSIKISALTARCDPIDFEGSINELMKRIVPILETARDKGVFVNFDMEHHQFKDLTIELFQRCVEKVDFQAGLAMQAYLKSGPDDARRMCEWAKKKNKLVTIRLVKGAYWDSEIKRAQERGLDGYPVFTRKASTDVSYIACARALLADQQAFYPCFATHNAHTVAVVAELAGNRRDWEFQRLHGMGETLYEEVVGADKMNRPCRVYAPVGGHEELLAYLVRRLLENGANTSFVNRLVDEKAPIDTIVADPVAAVRRLPAKPHPRIPLPRDLYGPERPNSAGIDLSDPAVLEPLARDMTAAEQGRWHAGPVIGGVERHLRAEKVTSPADRRRVIGEAAAADGAMVAEALSRAERAQTEWDRLPARERAQCLERAAELMEQERAALMAVVVREGGRTIPDALAEVREAVDFCRYYAQRARADFDEPLTLPGPTGEVNRLELRGRGVFACISPWNFPLAIFTGQIAAALAAGNAVVAKPAEQTPLVAARAVAILHRAGVPGDVLHLLPGSGEAVGAALTRDPCIAGIAFTGSTEVAKAIQRTLADRPGPIVPLIAETGGQNAMIVDSSALPEQVTNDAIVSAFHSAGQRCSALRVLFVQRDIADRLLAMLAGAMDELVVGDPALLSTDVGPVIDADAKAALDRHAERMAREGRIIRRLKPGPGTEHGTFFAPLMVEIDSLKRLEREVFGPILHVVRYAADRLDQVIDQVRATGYGLTLGIHSRIDETVRYVHERLAVGNTYVNRSMIGAVVGVQPFGGEGLSGTGPKAGGPRYLHRFATERTLSIDTTAAGGNASLLSLDEAG